MDEINDKIEAVVKAFADYVPPKWLTTQPKDYHPNDVITIDVNMVLATEPRDEWVHSECLLLNKLAGEEIKAQGGKLNYYSAEYVAPPPKRWNDSAGKFEDPEPIERGQALCDIPKQGACVVSWGDPSDGMYALVVNGEIKAGYYMSSRGSMWQAGACVREDYNKMAHYYACNMRDEVPCGEWVDTGLRDICASIGRDALLACLNASSQHILADEPNQFWGTTLTVEQWRATQQELMINGIKGYNKGEELVESRSKEELK